ncbi:SusC/RagA family TonB-linked outer membrane protein [Flavobacterium ardleyense]|uniref:SusC/RagA family TonB-linked outer membrane protein n=1 Tax=Flavobacterium ardleyense TaxID=2038737 RepID=A0ABW5ZD70_9FLAO
MSSKFNKLLALVLVLLSQFIMAQGKTVSGTVSDQFGMPLPGASVQDKGTKKGALTDFDGKFTIDAKQGATLVFSYVGMKTQEIVVSASTIDVSLQDDVTTLSDVVVTALGIKREKKAIGYSAQEISGSTLSEGGGSNALSSLSGNVSGLQITAPSSMGGSTRILMRGIGSVTGENRPLIVIDGIPLDNGNYNNLNTQTGRGGRDYGDASADINPDDIESVTVLKGGPAAALYGSRAGNGAILYTTKSGKKGGSRSEFTFSSGVTLESVNIMPDLQNEYGGGSTTSFATQNIGGQIYNIAAYGADESWGPKYDSNLKYLPWNAFDLEFPNDYLVEKPWVASANDVRSFFRTGLTTNNSISVLKSTDDAGIRFSYSNQQTEGIVPNSNLQKNSISLNANAKISDKLKVDGMLSYVQTKGFNRPEVGYGDNSLAQKFYQFGQRQLDFNVMKDYKLANGSQRSWNRTAYNNARPKFSDNPYWIINENTSTDLRNRLYGNLSLTYNITPDVYVVGNAYGDTYSLNISERVAIGSQATPSYSTVTRTLTDFNYEGRLHLDKKFGKISLNSFVGANKRSYKYGFVNGQTVGGLVLPNQYNLSNSVTQARSTNYDEQLLTNSIYGFASVGYDGLVFIEGTNRKDWFSTVVKPVSYSSVTGSFIFSQLLESSWLNYGKIRGGWAQAGSATTPYRLENVAVVEAPFGGAPSYSNPNTSNNKNLVPELKTTSEIGLEMSLFDKRFGFDVSVYKSITDDLITPVQVDGATGFSNALLNAGQLENKGIEVTLNVNPIRTKDFNWDVTWNFSKNKNELLKLYEDVQSLTIQTAPFQASLIAVVGQPYGQIYGTDFTYDANGNKLIDADGYYIASGQKSLGTITPDYNMGIRNTFRYKNLSLSALVDIQKGGNYFSTTHMFGMYSGMLEESAANGIRETGVVNEGVFVNGTANNVSLSGKEYSQQFYAGVDKLNVFDSDYFKLREVTLSYTFPSKYTGVFSGIKLSAYGRNLLTWGLDWNGMDPETASYGSGNTQGLEGGSLPSTRTYGMNLELKF